MVGVVVLALMLGLIFAIGAAHVDELERQENQRELDRQLEVYPYRRGA